MDRTDIQKPRTYTKKMSVLWWTRRMTDFRFIMRELTSLPVAWSCVLMILLVRALNESPDAYLKFLDKMSSPLMIILNVLAFAGLLFHSITWFSLAPKAMVIKIGSVRVPGPLIAWANYGGWLVISIVVAWMLFW